MVPGSMSSLAVASTVSRSATASNGLRFVADAAVPPKEHVTATTSARIRVVMISLLGHPPTSGYGTNQPIIHLRFDVRCSSLIGPAADAAGGPSLPSRPGELHPEPLT